MIHLSSWREPHLFISAIALVVAGACAGPANARSQTSPGNATAGHRLAEARCTQCHVIERSSSAGWTDAPSFPSIADRPNMSAQWLENFLSKPHMHMMHMPRSGPEASDLASYILSLRQR